jgi:small conductance mechanosensitive channel
MNTQALLNALTPKWQAIILIGSQVVLIAIVFEFLAWWAGRRIERIATAYISLDRGRSPAWRATRRATLRGVPKIVSRVLLYSIALILIFNAFNVPVLPLSLSIGAVALLFGAALLPCMRDYAQGYQLLSHDTLAPGDQVEINGHRGTVEKWTLQGTWLRDADGKVHVLCNRDVNAVVVYHRAVEETAATGTMAYDPLAGA